MGVHEFTFCVRILYQVIYFGRFFEWFYVLEHCSRVLITRTLSMDVGDQRSGEGDWCCEGGLRCTLPYRDTWATRMDKSHSHA